MDNALKLTLGIVVAAAVLGAAGSYALADSNNSNTMQNMMNGAAGMERMMGGGMMRGMMNGNFDMEEMHERMHEQMEKMHNGAFDMNQMHRAMHGEYPDSDMNGMHRRMMAGNITEEDINEMREHCPMMR